MQVLQDRPPAKGYVGSAVMLNAKLARGQPAARDGDDEGAGRAAVAPRRPSRKCSRWTDGSASHVTCEFADGKAVKWELVRPPTDQAEPTRRRRKIAGSAISPKGPFMSPVAPSMADRDGKIWMDGELVDWRDAKIHVLTHTLHYGCGAFEGVRAYNTVNGTAIFRLQEHTDRLFNSAKILRMTLPFGKEQVNEAQSRWCAPTSSRAATSARSPGSARRSSGVSPKGNQIHLMVAAWAWGAYLGEEGMQRGIRVKTSSYTRHHVNITMTQAKAVSNYSNSILANMEALDDGYDEALLLDSSGFVSEGAGENIFVIKDGVIYTPDLSAGALNGITRNTVFHICKDLGIEIVQKRITRDEIYIADEAFFTGTAPKSRRSASSTASRSAAARAAPSPRRSRARSSTS
jgi:branched-chain amino acid aminotransferase